jgi:sigma-54 dependent transcriptional regulator, acetoin dehydrogenase operon transcriptional activator AcoR
MNQANQLPRQYMRSYKQACANQANATPSLASTVCGDVRNVVGDLLPGMRSESGSDVRRTCQLIVVFAPDRHMPSPLALGSEPLRIGRDRDAALLLEDDEVSRHHAEVRYDDEADRWVICDCGSRNGLWVNGARVERKALAHGTVVRVGRTLLVMVDVMVAADRRLGRETQALRGRSLAMQQVRGEIARMVEQRIPLLVVGEAGVGKELVARELHRRSGRLGPFVPVNCATISTGAPDRELFGGPAGNLAGLSAPRDGLFGQARGGTLFLDEIGELPAELQPELARALAAGAVRPVGRTQPAQVDVQVIAATHRDLENDVASGAFHAGLYERLAGWVLRVPPLRERREDILDLAYAVLDRWRGGKLSLSDRAAEALLLYDWPFNVRELEHAIQNAAVHAGGTSRRGSAIARGRARGSGCAPRTRGSSRRARHRRKQSSGSSWPSTAVTCCTSRACSRRIASSSIAGSSATPSTWPRSATSTGPTTDHHGSMHGRLRLRRSGTDTEVSPAAIQRRVSAGSITSSISTYDAALIALPSW